MIMNILNPDSCDLLLQGQLASTSGRISILLLLMIELDAIFNIINRVIIMQFNFPINIEQKYKVVIGVQDLKSKIQEESKQLNLGRQHFKIIVIGDKIYCKCKSCPCFMRYKKVSSDEYVLFKHQTLHQHKKIDQNYHICRYIECLPNIPTSAKMKLTTDKFEISRSKFYYLHKKAVEDRRTWATIIAELDRLKYESRYDPFPLPEGQNPILFLTASPSMRQNFMRFGDVCSFDITYNLVRDRNSNPEPGQQPQYGVGLFMGKNSRNKIVPFAVCLLCSESTETMGDLFRSFFSLYHRKEPQTIITDQQRSIVSSLEILKLNGQWSGFHLLDCFHILKNIKKNTKNDNLLRELNKAMIAHTRQEYTSALSAARNSIQNNSELIIINKFESNADKYCFTKAPDSFLGLSISTSFGEKANDIIKQNLQHEKPIKTTLRTILHCLENLSSRSQVNSVNKIRVNGFIEWKEILMIKEFVCEKVYSRILNNFILSFSCQIKEEKEHFNIDSFMIWPKVLKPEQIFSCQCNYFLKCGLPCLHIIRILFVNKGNLYQQISQRWIINKQTAALLFVGRPRLSRRS